MRPAPTIVEPACLDELDELMQAESGAVVIEVGSGRSHAARAVDRAVRGVAATLAGRPVTFARIRIDRNPEVASEFKVRCVPTVLFCLDGEVLDATMGRIDEGHLRKKVAWLLERADGDSFFARLLRRRSSG